MKRYSFVILTIRVYKSNYHSYCSGIAHSSESASRRLSPNDKRKQVDVSDSTDKRSSEHVNVLLNEENFDNSDDTVQLVRREDNEHAIS